MAYTIAIDGPVGAGKSSVADEVARRLGILHLDTGAMYRALAWLALKENVDLENERALLALTRRAMPEVQYVDGTQHTLIDGTDVTGLIRTPEVSMAASTLSKRSGCARSHGGPPAGIGRQAKHAVGWPRHRRQVLPNATIKIFLTASPEARARRRFVELQQKGDPSTYEQVLSDVLRRDEQDTTRAASPLKAADDAQILDSSLMNFEQVVEDVLRRFHMRLGHMPRPAEKFTPVYSFARKVAGLLFSTIMPVTYHRPELAQLDAPYILIANHGCMLDPLLAAWKCYRYHIRFMGKKELTKHKPLKWLFDKLLMIPVDRHNSDMAAMRASIKTLKEGHSLGIFPEGTRYKQGVMEDLESGVAMIALRSGVPLLPAYIAGKPRFFHRLHVYYGQPFSVSDIAQKGVNKEACNEALERIRETFRTLVSEHEARNA